MSNGQGCDHETARFCLPPGVHDWASFFARHCSVPFPGLWVDWLTNAPQQAQATQIVAVSPGLPKTHQAADRSWSSIKNCDAIVFNHAPPAIGIRMGGRSFIHETGRTVQKWAIDDIAMPGNPAWIGGAPPAAFLFFVVGQFKYGVDEDHVTAVGVQNAFGATGGA